MTSKRTTKTDTVSAGGSVRRSRGASATHSRKPSAPVADATQTVSTEPLDPEAVARLAYSYWESRGGIGGSPEDDWIRAERELVNLHRSLESA
jgi:Protein of unknown function (DUF2934).